MLLSRILGRRDHRPARRPPSDRRPSVEPLEGRKLLSGIVGNHIGVALNPQPLPPGIVARE